MHQLLGIAKLTKRNFTDEGLYHRLHMTAVARHLTTVPVIAVWSFDTAYEQSTVARSMAWLVGLLATATGPAAGLLPPTTLTGFALSMHNTADKLRG